MNAVRAALAVLCVATTTLAAEEGLAEENRRLRDEVAALKAGDPGAGLRKAIEDYLSGPRPEDMPSVGATAEYQGGFALRSADGLHLLRINLWGRAGWNWYRDRAEAHGVTQAGFRVPDLRVRLSGHAFSERLRYFVDLEFAPNAERFDDDGDAVSEAHLTYRRPPWRWLRLRIGRLRPGFSSEEQAADEALVLAERGLVHEYFTVGRSDGLAAILEGVRGGRSRAELTITNGSERYDPSSAFVGDDKRRGFSFRWARTLVGEGDPATHLGYQGSPYDDPARTLVVGIGIHWEENRLPGTMPAEFVQATADVTWRHRGTYATVQVFVRRNRAGGTEGLAADDDDVGAQALLAYFVVPRKFELAARFGWLDYASHMDPGGDLVEATVGFNFYWTNEVDRFQGHRMRVTVDWGYAEHVALQSRGTGWPAGHGRGWQFRSVVTFVF